MNDTSPQKECARQNAGASREKTHFSEAPNGLLGMAADLSNLFSSLEILAGDSANLTLRRSVVRGAQGIAGQFNQASARLKGVEYGLNTSIQKDVVRSNYHLHDIASFNEQIVDTLAAGGTAEPWTSQRARCLDALACCVEFKATDEPDGSIAISIGGVTMVAGGQAPDCLATYPDPRGNLSLQAQNAVAPLQPASGTIAKKIAVRDGRLADLQTGLDSLASQLIARINSIYRTGCDINGATGRDFFTGCNAGDIRVNSTIVNDPSQLQTGGAAEESGTRMVALALAKLGSRQYLDLDHDSFQQSHTHGMSELEAALAVVNDSFNTGRRGSQQEALDAALDGETAGFMRYQQACASSARVITTLEQMTPMR